jgi:hypothetical protein
VNPIVPEEYEIVRTPGQGLKAFLILAAMEAALVWLTWRPARGRQSFVDLWEGRFFCVVFGVLLFLTALRLPSMLAGTKRFLIANQSGIRLQRNIKTLWLPWSSILGFFAVPFPIQGPGGVSPALADTIKFAGLLADGRSAPEVQKYVVLVEIGARALDHLSPRLRKFWLLRPGVIVVGGSIGREGATAEHASKLTHMLEHSRSTKAAQSTT